MSASYENIKLRYNIIVVLTENLKSTGNGWEVITAGQAQRIIDSQTQDPNSREPNVLVKGQREKLLIYNNCLPDELTAMITWQPPWTGTAYWTKVHNVPCKYLVDENGNEITAVAVKKERIERVLENI